MTTEERLLRLENAFATLVELAQNTDLRMDRIAEAQARTEANLEALTVLVGEIGRNVGALTDRVDALTGKVDALTGRVDALTGKVDVLSDKVDALTDTVGRLADAQAHTDEGLNNLIAVVDRYISEGRNGKP